MGGALSGQRKASVSPSTPMMEHDPRRSTETSEDGAHDIASSEELPNDVDYRRSAARKSMIMLCVRCGNGQVLTIDALSHMEVHLVKMKIARALLQSNYYLPPSAMRLVHMSKVLPDSGTLEAHGLAGDRALLTVAVVRDGAGRRFFADEEEKELQGVEAAAVHVRQGSAGAVRKPYRQSIKVRESLAENSAMDASDSEPRGAQPAPSFRHTRTQAVSSRQSSPVAASPRNPVQEGSRIGAATQSS